MSLIESHSLQKFALKRKPYWWDILLGMMVHGNGSFTTPIKYLPQKLINSRHFRGKLHTFVAFLMLPKRCEVIIKLLAIFMHYLFIDSTILCRCKPHFWNTKCDSNFERCIKSRFHLHLEAIILRDNKCENIYRFHYACTLQCNGLKH